MGQSNKNKPSELRKIALSLIKKIDGTQVLNSRKLIDDTKRLRILEMRKELDSILNPSDNS